MKNYKIKNGYRHRSDDEMKKILLSPVPGVMNDTDGAQREVYLKAKSIMEKENLKSIIDLGCGAGFKLNKHFQNFETIGFELEYNIKILRERYPNKRWEVTNFYDYNYENIDVVISADVIEHLIDPDEMMNWIKKISPKFVLISTPDRDTLINEPNAQIGPPQNFWHAREWNFKEFTDYVSDFFEIIEQYNTFQSDYYYQTVVCIPKK